eukprot:8567555-Pyramimonas_sp.AAC.1
MAAAKQRLFRVRRRSATPLATSIFGVFVMLIRSAQGNKTTRVNNTIPSYTYTSLPISVDVDFCRQW